MKYTYNLSDKIIAYLALISGLTISAVAVWYSVAGLVSIFAASALSIIIMGVALEASKLVATVWLKWNWRRAPKMIKIYLISAIAILMLITSMGIFGYLSKAHLDQGLVSGDVVDKVALIDEKIKTQRDNIEAARKAIRQMDEAVDQTMARSNDEKGADKAAALRRQQQRERTNLQNDIAKSQAAIAQLNEERAPIAKELRAVEAEVGPIKYIAKLIYGDNPDANILEKAVTWVIIIIVLVFDPLAVVLLLASQYSFQWFRQEERIEESTKEDHEEQKVEENEKEPFYDKPSAFWPFPTTKSDDEFKFLEEDKDLYPGGKPWQEEPKIELPVLENEETRSQRVIDEANEKIAEIEREVDVESALASIDDARSLGDNEKVKDNDDDIISEAANKDKIAMTAWKADNPDDSLKHQRYLLEKGLISKLPWEDYLKPEADFEADDAEAEAVKWALEQKEKRDAIRAQLKSVDAERPGDYLTEADSKKKDNILDGENSGTTDKKNQGRIEGYVQNAEQNESTIWQRVHKK
jgi:hypothetical protein